MPVECSIWHGDLENEKIEPCTPRKANKDHKSERWGFCTNRGNDIFLSQLFLLGFSIPPVWLSKKNVYTYQVCVFFPSTLQVLQIDHLLLSSHDPDLWHNVPAHPTTSARAHGARTDSSYRKKQFCGHILLVPGKTRENKNNRELIKVSKIKSQRTGYEEAAKPAKQEKWQSWKWNRTYH